MAEPGSGGRDGQHAGAGLLGCGCVFAALAGPALSLHTRSEALHQTLAGLSGTTKALQASTDWNSFTADMALARQRRRRADPAMLAAGTAEMSHGFTRLGVPLAPGA